MKIRTIRIKDIAEDEELYPRRNYEWMTAYRYSENMKQNVRFPPICVNEIAKGKYLLIDGKHRLEATKINKGEYIEAEIIYIRDKKDMYVEAVRRNIKHGLKLSTDSLRQIVLKLEDFGFDKPQIAELVQIPATKLTNFVGTRLIMTTTGRTIVSPQIQHIVGSTKYEKMTKADIQNYQEQFTSGSNQEQLLNEVLLLLQAEMIDKKNKKVVAILKQIRSKLIKMKL